MHGILLPLSLATLAVLPGGDPRPESLQRDPGPRTEYFVLEITDASPSAGAPHARPVGAVVLRRRTIEGGFQLEGEWQFDRSDEEGGSERVLHVEQISSAGSRLIWREWGPSRARSLSVTRGPGGVKLAFVDSARGGTRRETLLSHEPAWMPLELLERIRLGDSPPATCERIDPLSRSLERVEVRLLSPEAPDASAARAEQTPAARAYEIVRGDGTTAGRCEFLGIELLNLSWQQGDLVARRVDEEEYRARSPRSAVTIRRP